LAALALMAVFSPAALADEAHDFNPWLSLTGGCQTYVSDPVPDPDCPYPPGTPPDGAFSRPTGIAVDTYGNVYVASFGHSGQEDGRVDVFDHEGHYLTSVAESEGQSPRTIAVDSEGYLYVYAWSPGDAGALRRFDPIPPYNPAVGEIAYGSTPTLITENLSGYAALAVNPENDHLFVNFGTSDSGRGLEALVEFGAGADDNPLLDPAAAELNQFEGKGLAIDATRDRIYATDAGVTSSVVRVFELGAPHGLIETIDGADTPLGSFSSQNLAVAADEGTGHLFVYAQGAAEDGAPIYELTEDGEYLSTIKHFLIFNEQQIAVDNGAASENGALNSEGRYLWATSVVLEAEGHAFAFGPLNVEQPTIESLSLGSITETEAELRGEVASGLLETSYRFEYVTLAQFEASEFDSAQLAGEGVIGAGPLPEPVTAQALGLSAGTQYVFRLVATNELGSAEAESGFKTYPGISFGSCPNDAFRTGASKLLPDCRAYELVTPPDTNARSPMGLGYAGAYFPALPASPDGTRTSFRIEGGLLPGAEGSGSLAGDPYLATRNAGGWSTVATGGSGAQASAVLPGGRSPDQEYSVWVASGSGSAVLGGDTYYVRYPDGHSELLGVGSEGEDPQAKPMLISEGGGHMIFLSSVPLEEDSPASGTSAIYDRAGGTTHVASLLPGDLPPSPGAGLSYRGSSLDGRGIAFNVDGTLYLRVDNQQTFAIGSGVAFQGVAEGGQRIFYLQGGDLEAFDAATEDFIEFSGTGDATVVNVAADGSAAYFVSPTAIATGPNPLGDMPQAGKENLYLSQEGTISFVATVTDLDVEGEGDTTSGGTKINGLGLWNEAAGQVEGATPGRYARDPSRTTSGGEALLFQSRAGITDYESEGTIQVYRYDSAADTLDCISCNPTEIAASADATLQSVGVSIESVEPNNSWDVVANLSTDGRRALFQSREALVAADTDGLQDVYEWEAQGTGSCGDVGGCVYLLSSGQSGKDDYLYAAGTSGADAFIWTSDRLVPADADATPSLYDARVNGGFQEATQQPECVGESCRPLLSAPPILPVPGSIPNSRSGDLPKTCPKKKRKVRQNGKVRCVSKKNHKKPAKKRQQHGSAGKGGSK